MALSQFRLLAERRFGPLAAVWLLGAANANLCRIGCVASLAGAGLFGGDEAAAGYWAFGLFIAPVFLCSAIAGTLGDQQDKARLIRLAKLAEVAVALLAALALYAGSAVGALVALALFGIVAAIVVPLQYAVLPQHLTAAALTAGNALGHAATWAAILLGGLLGAGIGTWPNAGPVLAGVVAIVAAAGFAASRAIPPALPESVGQTPWPVNPIRETWAAFALAKRNRPVAQSLLGVAWFWLLGAVYIGHLGHLGTLAAAQDAASAVATLLLAVFAGAVVAGALACEKLSRQRVELGLVPIGAAGVSLFGVDGYFALAAFAGNAPAANLDAFLGADGTTRLLIDLGLLGVSLALFVVPLQANIQSRAAGECRGRVLAASHVLGALFAVAGLVLAAAWTEAGGRLPTLLLALALGNLLVAAYIFRQVPEFAMRFLVWAASHSFYRVRHEGLGAIPAHGPAVLVCNHVSYVDALLLAGAVPRPIRFVIYKPIYDIPVLNFVFRTGRTIPIAAEREDPAAFEAAFAAIRAGLAEGDLLCIFPEGRLTEDGRIGLFRKGIERIVAETPVPVVPMALRGLWGSFFSRHGKGAFHLKGRFWSRVAIVAGTPVTPAHATADALRQRVLALAEG